MKQIADDIWLSGSIKFNLVYYVSAECEEGEEDAFNIALTV